MAHWTLPMAYCIFHDDQTHYTATPRAHGYLLHEFDIPTRELALRRYPWLWIKHTFYHINLLYMPIDGAFAKEFKKMWGKLPNKLASRCDKEKRK